MNVMKFTGKTIAVCFAAGIAAAALSACGDKKTDEPAAQPGDQTQKRAFAASRFSRNHVAPAVVKDV